MTFSRLKIKSEFLKNVLTLITGTSFAQALPVLVSPVLSRLYSPEDFALLALYLSITGIIAVISTARYEIAVLLPRRNSEADNIIFICIGISTVIGLITLIVFSFFNNQITLLFGNTEISDWLYLIPVSVLLLGFYQTMTYSSLRSKDFRRMSASKILRSSSIAIVNIILGVLHLKMNGLISGQIVGHFIGSFYLGGKFLKNIRSYMMSLSKYEISRLAKKYENFPRFNLLHSLFNTLSNNLPVIFLTNYFPFDLVGFYSFSLTLIIMPITLISASTGQVLNQRITYLYNNQQPFYAYIKKLILRLIGIGLLPYSLFILFAPGIFGFLFGEIWVTAGVYTQVLSPWAFMTFIVSTLAYVPAMLNFQKKALIIEIVSFVCKISGLFIGIYRENILLALGLFSLAGFLILCYSLFWTMKISRNFKR